MMDGVQSSYLRNSKSPQRSNQRINTPYSIFSNRNRRKWLSTLRDNKRVFDIERLSSLSLFLRPLSITACSYAGCKPTEMLNETPTHGYGKCGKPPECDRARLES